MSVLAVALLVAAASTAVEFLEGVCGLLQAVDEALDVVETVIQHFLKTKSSCFNKTKQKDEDSDRETGGFGT